MECFEYSHVHVIFGSIAYAIYAPPLSLSLTHTPSESYLLYCLFVQNHSITEFTFHGSYDRKSLEMNRMENITYVLHE